MTSPTARSQGTFPVSSTQTEVASQSESSDGCGDISGRTGLSPPRSYSTSSCSWQLAVDFYHYPFSHDWTSSYCQPIGCSDSTTQLSKRRDAATTWLAWTVTKNGKSICTVIPQNMNRVSTLCVIGETTFGKSVVTENCTVDGNIQAVSMQLYHSAYFYEQNKWTPQSRPWDFSASRGMWSWPCSASTMDHSPVPWLIILMCGPFTYDLSG